MSLAAYAAVIQRLAGLFASAAWDTELKMVPAAFDT
jgi:hypothetical protein